MKTFIILTLSAMTCLGGYQHYCEQVGNCTRYVDENQDGICDRCLNQQDCKNQPLHQRNQYRHHSNGQGKHRCR